MYSTRNCSAGLGTSGSTVVSFMSDYLNSVGVVRWVGVGVDQLEVGRRCGTIIRYHILRHKLEYRVCEGDIVRLWVGG